MASLLDNARAQLAAALREAEREVQRLRAAVEALGGRQRRQRAKPARRTPVAPSAQPRTPSQPKPPRGRVQRAKAPQRRPAAAGRKDSRQAVLDAVKSNPGVNATNLTTITGLSMGTVRSRLTQLADEGLIRREGTGAKTGWHPRS